jgi:hemoglobin-like flavoprotein
MSLNVPLLRSSFDLVVTNSPDITRRFYDIFFANYPQVRPMFSRNSRDKQEQMLTQALVLVMEHLEDAPWLTTTLQGMGEKHVSYGVRDEMYGWVGESLLTALGEAAGEAWTPELQQAWADAFGAISGLMLAGAARAQAPAAE